MISPEKMNHLPADGDISKNDWFTMCHDPWTRLASTIRRIHPAFLYFTFFDTRKCPSQ